MTYSLEYGHGLCPARCVAAAGIGGAGVQAFVPLTPWEAIVSHPYMGTCYSFGAHQPRVLPLFAV